MATTIVRPNADSSVAFTPLGGGTNHSEVSEAVADEDTSYNTSSDDTEADIDMFTFANAGIAATDTIDSVILTVRARDTGGGNATLYLRVSHDALYESGAEVLGTGYGDLTHDVTTNETWEAADFDGQGVTIGYRVGGNSSTRERRVTQVFLTISHTPTPAGATRGSHVDQVPAPILGAQVNRGHPLAVGLEAFYVMNHATGDKLVDVTGNGYDGTLTGMTDADWDGCAAGSSLHFDAGTKYVLLPESERFRVTPGISVMAFVCEPSSTGSPRDGTIVGKAATNAGLTHVWALELKDTTFEVEWEIETDAGSGVITTAAAVNDGNPHVFVATWHEDDGSMALYQDGFEEATGTRTGTLNNELGDMTIGRGGRDSPEERDYNGHILAVGIWRRKLTAAEAKLLAVDPFCVLEQEVPAWAFATVAAGATLIAQARSMHRFVESRVFGRVN